MHEVNTVIKAKLVLDGVQYYGLHSDMIFPHIYTSDI